MFVMAPRSGVSCTVRFPISVGAKYGPDVGLFWQVEELDFGLRKLVVTSCSGSPLFIVEICQSLCATEGLQTVETSSRKVRNVHIISHGVPPVPWYLDVML